MQETERLKRANGNVVGEELDYYWTLVGYFNAIRELASAENLYREDIPSRMREPSKKESIRPIEDHIYAELSSNISSSEIPGILERLEENGAGTDAAFVTSMLGTGVDIDRLSLMIVHGQPKSSSSYIQATGRVGRKKGALVVTFLRSTRPRDLDHYEFFTGYHRALYCYVEPVTVFPFSPRAYERAIGPVMVSMLRNAYSVKGVRVNPAWAEENYSRRSRGGQSGARLMTSRRTDPEIEAIIKLVELRGIEQPDSRAPKPGTMENYANSEFDRWAHLANRERDLYYYESTFSREPKHAVVLGDSRHRRSVFSNAPQSMREVESTTRFAGR